MALTWVSKTSGVSALTSVASNNAGTWVAVGGIDTLAPGQLTVSTDDGVTWTAHPSNAFANDPNGSQYIGAVIWDGAQFVACAAQIIGGSYSTVGTSPDGVTWTLVQLPSVGDNFAFCMAYGAGIYVVLESSVYGSSPAALWTSPDLVTWTTHDTTATAVAGGADNIIFDGTHFICGPINFGGSTPTIAYSADGATWTAESTTTFAAGTSVNTVGYNGSVYLAVGYNFNTGIGGHAEVSSTLIPWAGSAVTTGLGDDSVGVFGGTFIAGDFTGHVADSLDGVTWEAPQAVFGSSDFVIAVGYNNVSGVLVAVSSSGGLATTFVTPPPPSGNEVPNIVGDTPSVANGVITAALFTVGAVSFAYDPMTPEGIVNSQSPAAGTTFPAGTAIAYTISNGPQPVVVPNLVGLTQALGNTALTQSQLVPGVISFEPDQIVPAGVITAQTPQAGALAAPGEAVSYTVSTGPVVPPLIVPFDWDQTVISQFQNSPSLLQLLDNMGQYLDPTVNLQTFFDYIWNVNTAVGFGLDIWGVIVGVSRIIHIPGTAGNFGFFNSDTPPDWENFGTPLDSTVGGPFFNGGTNTGGFQLNDDAYRTLILAKALANIAATTAPALNQLLTNLFPGRGVAYVKDNFGMSMSYVFQFPLSTIEFAILSSSGVIPRPAGVLANIIVQPADADYLGFAEMGPPGADTFGFGIFHS